MLEDPLEIAPALQKHFDVHGARASEFRTYLGHKVYLAEGGPHLDAKLVDLPEDMAWMKQGYYLAVWAVLRDRSAGVFRPQPQHGIDETESRLCTVERSDGRCGRTYRLNGQCWIAVE